MMRGLIAVCCWGMMSSAHADPIPILNHSFENPGANPGQFVGGINIAPPGWTVYNTVAPNEFRYFGVVNPSTTSLYAQPMPDGANCGVVFLLNTTNIAEAGLRQTLATTLVANSQYTLRVDVGNMAYEPSTPQWDFNGFPGYRVELMAGNTVLASDNNTLLPAEGFFLPSTVTFQTTENHALLGQNLAIRLVNLNGPGIEVNFDNVRLDVVANPVPEPGLILAIAGTLGGLAYRYRRSLTQRPSCCSIPRV